LLKNNTLLFSSPHPTPSESRFPFATQFTKHPLLPPLIPDRFISRYPPAQYKTTDGAPGIGDGAGISKQVYDKYDDIKTGNHEN
jgi:hypothetical protein